MAKILLIESNPLIADAISQWLATDLHEVISALRGNEDVLRIAHLEEPALVLLDAEQLGQDGIPIARMLRRVSDTAIILLTTSHPVAGETLGFDADDYLIKPIEHSELLGRVRVALRRAAGRRGHRLHANGLEIDLVSRRAYLERREINLSHKEFELLAMLLRYKGTVLSRQHLIERIWGGKFGGDPRTVDVHVRWLRKKIEGDPSHPKRLQTVRGIGYRID